MMYYKSRNIMVKAVRFLNTTESILQVDEMLGGVAIRYHVHDKPQVMLSGGVTADVGDWVALKGNSVFVLSDYAFNMIFKEEV